MRYSLELETTPEKFDAWLQQLVHESGYTMIMNTAATITYYTIQHDTTSVAEVESMPTLTGFLRVMVARVGMEHDGPKSVAGFVGILDKALQRDFHTTPFENGIENGLIDFAFQNTKLESTGLLSTFEQLASDAAMNINDQLSMTVDTPKSILEAMASLATQNESLAALWKPVEDSNMLAALAKQNEALAAIINPVENMAAMADLAKSLEVINPLSAAAEAARGLSMPDMVAPSYSLVPLYPSPEERLADEMAENNRINREILELMKRNSERGVTETTLSEENALSYLPTPQMQKMILDAYAKKTSGGATKASWQNIRDELYDKLNDNPESTPILRKRVYAMWQDPEARAEIDRRGLADVIHKPRKKK